MNPVYSSPITQQISLFCSPNAISNLYSITNLTLLQSKLITILSSSSSYATKNTGQSKIRSSTTYFQRNKQVSVRISTCISKKYNIYCKTIPESCDVKLIKKKAGSTCFDKIFFMNVHHSLYWIFLVVHSYLCNYLFCLGKKKIIVLILFDISLQN